MHLTQAREKCSEYFPGIADKYGESADLLVCGGTLSLEARLVRAAAAAALRVCRRRASTGPHAFLSPSMQLKDEEAASA